MTASSANDPLEITLESGRFDCTRLRVRKLTGSCALSRLFQYDLQIACLDSDGIDLGNVMGESVTIVFTQGAAGEVSRVHGIVAEVDEQLGDNEFRGYRFRIMPRAHWLSLGQSQEIYLGATIPELITRKLAAVGMPHDSADPDVLLHLSTAYAPREFVVQYKETDLAFVCRLAEHLGISFYFDHEGAFDRMVWSDVAHGFAIGDTRSFAYEGRGEKRGIFEIEAEHRLIPKNYTVHDYNYRLPHVAPWGSHELSPEVGFAGDVIENGAHVKTPLEAEMLAKIRAEERQATQLVYTGRSALPEMQPGMRFEIAGCHGLESIELLVVEVHHEATVAMGHSEGAASYSNSFRAIPADRTYRPPRTTPRPRIAGFITGVIDASNGGSSTYAPIDDQGRYHVRFLFDTTTPEGRQPSHTVRMLQNHAGVNYGTHFPLKPGVEVLLAFVDGDPDRPIIAGAVPNPLTPSPVTKAMSDVHTIKTSNGTRIECR